MSLSEAEKQMLRWSESDPDFTAEPALVEKLGQENSDEAYEAKVVELLQHSYRRDVDSDPSARDRYRQAYVALGEGDHYILIMIDRVLGRRLPPWWMFWR